MELSAVAVQGHPPLPTYRASVRNASDRPVRRVIATVVYLDANGRALPGENQDVAFGSPLEAIDPGVTIETMFLSRVDSASEVQLVVRVVTFLEKGTGTDPVPREWKNPRYELELAEAEGRRSFRPQVRSPLAARTSAYRPSYGLMTGRPAFLAAPACRSS
ncbi:MAG: hypothetical protein IPL90_16945 [Holophagales bacterium]|nr:hypothetical protein [Holophagales bacterium]